MITRTRLACACKVGVVCHPRVQCAVVLAVNHCPGLPLGVYILLIHPSQQREPLKGYHCLKENIEDRSTETAQGALPITLVYSNCGVFGIVEVLQQVPLTIEAAPLFW